MTEEFRNFVSDNSLFSNNDRILLAVSGGIDSMVMSHLFIKSGAACGIAHCNFNLRGKESDGDEELVRKFAGRNKLLFYSVSFDTTGFAAEKGISVQMAARELRYRWFEEVRRNNGFDYIALGHNLNDNTETFLINLSRGTGLAGLTGMRPKSGKLIRPLLFASRRAIEEYCKKYRIRYREDRSNAETKYLRNNIRHKIIPLFREINPSFDTTLVATAERLGEINDIVNAFISDIRKRAVAVKDGLTVIKLKEISKEASRKTILFELCRPFGITSRQTGELSALSEARSGAMIITASSILVKNRNEIIISPLVQNDDLPVTISKAEEFSMVPGFVSVKKVKTTGSLLISPDPCTAYLDADKAGFPLIVRKWRHGDYFYPFGMESRKKLSDHFIDRKFSIPRKERQKVLEKEGKIVWVIGDRIDNRFRITPETKEVIIIKSRKTDY